MDEIGAFEAKNKLAELLDRVEHGEEIVITRRGKRVAKLVPAEAQQGSAAACAAATKIRVLAREMKLGRFDWKEWKTFRDHSRR
jgi:prevent-host-death family protein